MDKKTVIVQSVQTTNSDKSISERLAASVDNSGNHLFQGAIIRQIDADRVINDWEEVKNETGTVVLTLANFVRPDISGLEYEAEILDKSQVEKVILVGIGAQSYDYDPDLQIAPAAKRVLDIASERSKSIGVRGYYTAEILNRHGIKNVEVIGCPSLFYNCDPNFRATTRPPFESEKLRLSINATPSGFFRDKVSELFAYAAQHEGDYVLQNEQEIIPLLEAPEPDEAQERQIRFFSHYYNNGSKTPTELREWLRTHAKIFFSVDEWLQYSKTRDLVMGCRFHGNVVALLAGTPTVTFHFDTRTREMCEYLALPNLPFVAFDPSRSPEYYQEFGDYECFNAAFPRKYTKYVRFLEDNGLKHRLQPPTGSATPDAAVEKKAEDLSRNLGFTDLMKFRSVFEAIQSGGFVNTARAAEELAGRLWTERPQNEREAVEAVDRKAE